MSNLTTFFKKFYSVADTKPSSSDPFLDFFTEDATWKMGVTEVKGHQGISAIRQGIWQYATTSEHTVKLSTLVNDKEVLLLVDAKQDLINGKSVSAECAAHMIFEDEKLEKLVHYQVFLDPTLVNEASKPVEN